MEKLLQERLDRGLIEDKKVPKAAEIHSLLIA